MTYRAPVEDLLFAMTHAAGLKEGLDSGIYADLADGMTATLLSEAARFAEDVLAPINRSGDEHGASLANGVVTTAPGWKEAYAHWREGGWQGLVAAPDHGGMGLPHLVETACFEMWSAANMAFMLGPLLSFGAADAIAAHGSAELREHWLGRIVSGEWTATMNLTEPQAGSDLNALRARAERAGDGTYRISGQKIFITYGEHDLADNIVHLVLARLPDAPAGTRGISLFLVPKFLLDAQGRPSARNDVRCAGLEHKMGIHGSPTCTMVYGDDGGATGWLVGEENRGLACMFTMMNAARLAVGVQGVALGDRATQQALAYARERRQGKAAGDAGSAMSPIAMHPDVQRMLMTMRARTEAARLICLMTANAIDLSKRATDETVRREAGERAGLLTPVAKAFSTDVGNEVTSLGVQVHGGMGFIEETGAAQHMRDVRIAAIYEGTNGIQAIDLVTRKLALSGGAPVAREIAAMRRTVARLREADVAAFGGMPDCLADCLDALETTTRWMLSALAKDLPDALAAATPYLRLFGLARGGTGLAEIALAAHRQASGADDRLQAGRIAVARFFAEHLVVESPALEASILRGSASVHLAAIALEPA
jgi:acyl-CoA dehydrogenase